MKNNSAPGFLTFRRYHIDRLLSSVRFEGNVLDIGGKKRNKRGHFLPPLASVTHWKYCNIDASTEPDYCCSAEAIPVDSGAADTVVMTEVLEHIEHPERVLAEVCRIVKPGGRIVVTMPFLAPIHADPHDFQRWTPARLKLEFEKTGLTVERIEPMGGLFAVMYDLLYVSLRSASKNSGALKNRFARRFLMPVLRRLFLLLDNRFIYKSNSITTGYFVLATRGRTSARGTK